MEESDDGADLQNDENYVRNFFKRLVSWKSPFHSSLCLMCLLLVYALMKSSEVGIVPIFSFVIMGQLFMTYMARIHEKDLIKAGVVGKRFSHERFAAQRQLITPSQITRLSSGLALILGGVVERWEYLLAEEEDIAVVAVVGVMLAAFASLNLFVATYEIVLICAMVALSLGPVYLENQEAMDETIEQAWHRLDAVLN